MINLEVVAAIGCVTAIVKSFACYSVSKARAVTFEFAVVVPCSEEVEWRLERC